MRDTTSSARNGICLLVLATATAPAITRNKGLSIDILPALHSFKSLIPGASSGRSTKPRYLYSTPGFRRQTAAVNAVAKVTHTM